MGLWERIHGRGVSNRTEQNFVLRCESTFVGAHGLLCDSRIDRGVGDALAGASGDLDRTSQELRREALLHDGHPAEFTVLSQPMRIERLYA